MTSVGERLRRERIRQGIDLASLAKDTRINLKYLEAIEAGDPSKVPGGFFYRSFVRQYANFVGLNAAELEAELERAREAEAPALSAALQEAQFPLKEVDPIVVSANRRLAGGRTWAYVLLLAGVLTGTAAVYNWLRHSGIPTELAEQSQPATPPAVTSEGTQPVPLTQPASISSAAPSSPAANAVEQVVMTAPDDKVVLTVAAREATWISITSDGKTVFNGLLEPSQTKVLGGKLKAFVRVGNAGGLEITWNGKPIGPIGERGQVKNLLFTPENYQILPPAGRSL